MKTVVSIPDELFQLTEAAAKRLDEIYATERSRLDSAFRRAQAKTLIRDSW